MTGLTTSELRCPHCGGQLSRIAEGLQCASTAEHSFPILDGIASFLGRHEFDGHWQTHGIEPIPSSKLLAAKSFLAPLAKRLTPDARVLDAGCGDGVHAVLLQALDAAPDYVGLDISHTAIATARSRVQSGQFLHADMTHLPLADNSVDAAFSFGVIAYTGEPEQAVRELARVVRPDGLVGLWVYPRATGIGGTLFTVVRWLCRRGGPWVTRRIADLIVPIMGLLPSRSGIHLGNASWKQCREVVLVNIAPTQLAFPEPGTVREWVQSAGLELVTEDKGAPVTIWARKRTK